ncbi:SapC family protein [Thorsellia kenyensis]|uniref:SapC family protein n=1 Tax=Thorsellia kenyensis TaxID=1549888 RepID=A0ABV6CFG3_9GAMM
MQNNYPLFYKNPAVLNTRDHAKIAITQEIDFSFAKETIIIPVVVSEFMPLIRHYPIVFTQSENPSAVAIMGIKQNENLFVNDGQWKADTYIPAYVRRYPFIFFDANQEDNKTQQFLAIDLEAKIVDLDNSTLAEDRFLFNKEGEQTDLLKAALTFCENFHREGMITQEFIKALKQHDLLQSNSLNMKSPSGEEQKIDGFMLIDQAKYQALSDDTLLEFQKKGWAALITLQMASLQNWQLLFEAHIKASSNA